jgi:hypothetical protein
MSNFLSTTGVVSISYRLYKAQRSLFPQLVTNNILFPIIE